MVNLTYLPAIIPTTIVVYSLVVAVVLYLYHRQEVRILESSERPTISLLAPKQPSILQAYFAVLPFQFTYQSLNPYGGRLLLLITRLMSLGYIFGIPGLWNFINHDFNNLFYFTHWNILMISTYYACAISSSVIGFLYNQKLRSGSGVADNSWMAVESPISTPEDDVFWSAHVKRLGFVIQILFEVAGGSALFVTVVAFSFLNPNFEFWNVSDHFVTSMTFLVEMAQNTMIIRWHHVLLNMFWAMLYLFYIWPAVGSGAVTDWPYSFLNTANAGCFGWYFMLFFGNAVFYTLWYSLSRVKYEYIYASTEAVKGVLPAHYRGTGVRYDSSSTGTDHFSRNNSIRGMLAGDSTHDVVTSQDSPMGRRSSGNGAVGFSRASSEVRSVPSLTGIEQRI